MPEMAGDLPTEDESRGSLTAMSFLDHLEELRRRLIYSILAVTVGFFACWNYHEFIFSFVQRPIMEALHRNGMAEKLVYLNPTEPFNLYLKVAALAGLFLTSPFVLYQVWMFISPGLYRHEKKYVFPFMFSTVFLFLAGRFVRLQDGLSGGPELLDRLRKTIPTDDHNRGVYRFVFDHHGRDGCDFRVANSGLFFGADGNCERRIYVA